MKQRAAGRDDAKRFRALYAGYGDRIYRFCVRLCGREADAEDLAQEVFVAAFQGWDRFAGRSAVQTWLYKIALYRWHRLRPQWQPGDVSWEEAPEAADPHGDPARAGLHRLSLEAALAQLPDDLHDAFVLVKAEGLKYREAALVLDAPQGTVQWRVSEAARRLRVLLESRKRRLVMPTDRTRPLLNALADGELSPWTAARVRRHLKTCGDCRAEYDAIVALGAQARAWRDVPHAPAALETRLNDALAKMTQTEEETPMPTTIERPTPAAPWTPPRPRRVLRPALVGAGAFAALLAAAALLLPGSPGRPTVAFAEVQKAMRAVRAVSWTEDQTRDKGGRVILHNTHQFWVRRDAPAVAEWDSASTLPQAPGEEYAGPTRSLSDARGQTYVHTQEGIYYLHPAPDIARQVARTIDDMTAARADSYGTPKRVTLAGRPALRFHQHGGEYDLTIWADPQTLRVVRKRTDMVVHFPSGAEHIVLDATGFQYDAPAPSGVFDLAPPPGARVTEDDGKGNKTLVALKR